MATNNGNNNQYTNNADGFSLAGGTTPRTLSLTAGNVSLSAGGSNTYTMPSATDTLVGRASTDTLTNKTINGSNNNLTNVPISSLGIIRNNNGSSGTTPTQREVGWVNPSYAMVSGTQVVTVTFYTPFASGVIPIVTATFAGDSSSTGATYGTGGNVQNGKVGFKIVGITNTNFSFFIYSTDGYSATSGSYFITYTAEG